MPNYAALMNRRRRLWLFSAPVGTAGAALVLFVLIRWGPAYPALALLSIGEPVLPAIALVMFLVPTLMGGPWLARSTRGLCGAAAVLSLGMFLSSAGSGSVHLPAAISSPRTVRIVEFNAWSQNRAPDRAARWIIAQRPDIVVLLEAAGGGAEIARRLAPTFPHRIGCRGDRPCSTLILARLAPVERRGLARGDADNRRALSAAYMRLTPPQGDVGIVAVHLSRPLPLGRQQRELTELASRTADIPRNGLILLGDFNAPPWSTAVRSASRLLRLQPLAVRASWPAPDAGALFPPLFPIDQVLLGSGWSAASVVRGPALGSDHYPFVITLERGVESHDD